MLAKKSGKNFSQKAIAFLLILQTVLIGIKAENCIQQGDSTIDVLIWMINQYIPVLQRLRRLEDKDNKEDKQNKCAGDIKN